MKNKECFERILQLINDTDFKENYMWMCSSVFIKKKIQQFSPWKQDIIDVYYCREFIHIMPKDQNVNIQERGIRTGVTVQCKRKRMHYFTCTCKQRLGNNHAQRSKYMCIYKAFCLSTKKLHDKQYLGERCVSCW